MSAAVSGLMIGTGIGEFGVLPGAPGVAAISRLEDPFVALGTGSVASFVLSAVPGRTNKIAPPTKMRTRKTNTIAHHNGLIWDCRPGGGPSPSGPTKVSARSIEPIPCKFCVG